MRLKRVHCTEPGYTRTRRGKGFIYRDQHGTVITDKAELERLKALVIPPAWNDVWICRFANGHIQATGTDSRGRKQYKYHDIWRSDQDRLKFAHMADFGNALPSLRARIATDLAVGDLRRDQVLAGAVRLLDLGFFRIGGEDYAEQNHTYGLATMRKSHVTLQDSNSLLFDYIAKASKHRVQAIVDPQVYQLVRTLKSRRSGGPELLAYKANGQWRDVKSQDINDYVRSVTGKEFSAKDFRTWNATVLASVALAVSVKAATSPTAKKRIVYRAVKEVSDYLGNTPAVARSSYIDPVVIDLFDEGITIARSLDRLGLDTPPGHPATQGAIEGAVLKLLKKA